MSKYEIYAPSNNLKLLGFTDEDILDLRTVLEAVSSNSLIDYIEYFQKSFDVNEMVQIMLKDESIRESVIKNYQHIHGDNLEVLKERLNINDFSYSLKWNLFILLTASKTNPDTRIGLDIYLNMLDTNNLMFVSYLDAAIEMYKADFTNVNNIYNVLSKTTTLERTGWVEQKIPTKHLESIAEHMYMMMWLVDLYLEDSLDYNKDDIKKMCFLHDIGETLMGDINYLVKNTNDDILEDLKVKSLLLGMLYCGMSNANTYLKLWEDWVLNLDYTAKVAHDIDTLQLNYQFHNYATIYPNAFTDEEVKTWLIRFPKTEIGKAIYEKLVNDNPIFAETLKRIKNA